MMPIAGRLVWRLGPAPLLGAGLLAFVPAVYAMSHWTLQSGYWDLFWPQVGRGVAMGLMFVPLSTATLRALPPAEVLQGAGLYNLFRQLGGSMGIATLATLVDHRGALHRALLAEHVTPLSEAARVRLDLFTAGLVARGLDPETAARAAYEALERIVASQAALLAFRDCYLLIVLLFLALVPLVPLLQRPPAAPAR